MKTGSGEGRGKKVIKLFKYTGWPKSVSHYHKSLLNCAKTRHCGYIFHQFRLENE